MPFPESGRVAAVREAGAGVEITSERRGRARLLTVRGELDLRTVPQLRLHLSDAVHMDDGDVVLDLTDVSFIDSTGISALLNALRRLTRARRRLILVCAEYGAVARMMRMTRLDGTFPVHTTRDAALGSAGEPVAA